MEHAKPKRTRTNDPANTRCRVLDAAAGLFHRRGFADTSMQDVMQEARVTSGALHHHYRTKKELGLAVIRERVAAMVSGAWIDPLVQAPNASAGISDAFNGIIVGLQEGQIVGCPLNNLAIELANADPEFRSEIQLIFDQWQRALSQRISETKMVAPSSGVTSDELATLIIASYSGAMTMAKTAQAIHPLTVTSKLLSRLWEPVPS